MPEMEQDTPKIKEKRGRKKVTKKQEISPCDLN